MSEDAAGLVGRARALATLDHALRAASTEGPRFVVVTAAEGVGKTALVETLAAGHDGPVLRAAGAPWETERAGGVVTQLFPGAVTHDPAAVVAALREGTTLAVVDDAQWADEESLRALVSAVRHHASARLLVVAATTSTARDVLRHASPTVVALDPLGVAETERLAAARGLLLSPSMAERLTTHTGGVARHVVDLLAEAPPEVWQRFAPELPAPASVAQRVREALARCSPQARRFAEAVGVLGWGDGGGEGAGVRDAALLAGLEDGLLDVIDEVSRLGLARLGPCGITRVDPAGPMVRAAILATLGPAEAARLRGRAAELVDDAVQRARLRVAATPVPDAALADTLDTLAGECAERGEWAVAASLLSDAGRLTEDRRLGESRRIRAVDALIGAGDVLGAVALVPEIESLRETPLRDAVLGYLAIVRGRPTEAEARLSRAWALVRSEHEPDVAALICQRYVLHFLACCRPGELVEWADRAIALAGPQAPAGVEAAAIRGLGLAGQGQTARALEDYAELAERVRHGAQAQRIVMARGWLGLELDAVDEARADLESAVPTTVLGGSTRISLWASAWLARALFLSGDWDDAVHTVRAAQAVLDRSGIVVTAPLLQWTAVAVHALRDEWEDAAEALRRADAGARDYEIMRVPSCLAHAQLAEAKADTAGVLRALRPLAGSGARGIADPGQWPWADMYANALVVAGRHDEAEEFLPPHEQLAAERGTASAQARLGAARGHLAGARGELAVARSAFEEALELLEDSPLRYDRARIELVRGQVLRRAGKRREADDALTAARDGFAALGAVSCVDRCDRELKAGGVRASRADREPGVLTPQEDAVSRLVVRGLSNRDVAAELYVSTKTVQYHLTRIYAKLGIRSRVELAARLGDR